ncbi:hypothetical protein U9946_21840 [Escherichia coli]
MIATELQRRGYQIHMLSLQCGDNPFLELSDGIDAKEGANKRGNSSRLTQSFHFFMFEPIFSPVNALNQPI